MPYESHRGLTLDRLRLLPPTITVPDAGRWFGMSKPASYRHAADGTFPVPILTLGQRYWVRTADLAAALGVPPEALLAASANGGSDDQTAASPRPSSTPSEIAAAEQRREDRRNQRRDERARRDQAEALAASQPGARPRRTQSTTTAA